jgi:hypothetical protein
LQEVVQPGEDPAMHDMRQLFRVLVLFVLLTLTGASAILSAFGSASPPQSVNEPVARYGVGTWDADIYGNHRAVVRVQATGEAVWVHLPWRRRDQHPEQKEVVVLDAATGKRVDNIAKVALNREFGDFVFEPTSGPGTYYFYYFFYSGNAKSPYPKLTPVVPKSTASREWLTRNGLLIPESARSLGDKFPAAELVEFQSIDEFNSFYPMEVIATAAETSTLLSQHPQAQYLVFPEDRSRSIRMNRDLPAGWIERGPGGSVRGDVDQGEFYVFQLGIWAARASLAGVGVRFSTLQTEDGKGRIPSEAFQCFNFGGVDPQGVRFDRVVDVPQGAVQALWCGVQVPDKIAPGLYRGVLNVVASGQVDTAIPVELTVKSETIRNAGDDDPMRLSRLRWLDSKLAEDEEVVPPYSPVEVRGKQIHILGRQVTLADTGIPSSIQSYFDIDMTRLAAAPRQLLGGPIALVAEDERGQVLSWRSAGVRFSKDAPGAVHWESNSTAGPVRMKLRGLMEFDGSLDFDVAVESAAPLKLNDIRLEIPFANDVARYVMGLGLKGGTRPENFQWKWDVKYNQDSAWIGDVNAGIQFSLRDDHYARPMNTNFYQSMPLVMPVSWSNQGQGGCKFGDNGAKIYRVTCYSGARTLLPGQPQHYNFRLLLTPFHLMDTQAQWSTRFFHDFKPLNEVAATGANTLNIHHATPINPYINYPFLRPAEMKQYFADAHRRGMRTKIYYTIREITNHSPELFALESLGDEVITAGKGGGGAWLQEHLNGNYNPAWHVPEYKDAAVSDAGTSRWYNFYVEGLRWLVENEEIDGIYIDDVAFDRATTKRVRKILTRGRPHPLIDLHCANQFNPNDGFASCANLYLEHLPYIDRLWFGEYFDYNSPPDYWLTELSGIPFGLMGEMLQDGGNPWRGMLFGMTTRLPHSGDPRPLWQLWDKFGLEKTHMIGFWVPTSPVKTSSPNVLATVYQADGRALVAVASWSNDRTDINLSIDWKALGIDPKEATIKAPAIANFQDEASFMPDQLIPVQPRRGWLLWIAGTNRAPTSQSGAR